MSRLTTPESYRRAVQGLWVSFRKESSGPDEIGHLITHCEAVFPSYAKSTIRFNAAALQFVYRSHKNAPRREDRELFGRITNLKFVTSFAVDLLQKKRTSARPSKHCSTKRMNLVLEALSEMDSDYAPLASLQVVCGLVVGIRPCEWASAQLSNKQLKVLNAKQEDGLRAFEGLRTLDLSGWDDQQISLLLSAIALLNYLIGRKLEDGCSKEEATYRVYRGVSECIRKACKRSGIDGSISLYSLRHQCIANLRGAGVSSFEISVVMGHRSEHTHKRHYCRVQMSERTRSLVMPVRQDMETVSRLREERGVQKAWTRRDARAVLAAPPAAVTFRREHVVVSDAEPQDDDFSFEQ